MCLHVSKDWIERSLMQLSLTGIHSELKKGRLEL